MRTRLAVFLTLLITVTLNAKTRAVAPPATADALGIGKISGSAISGTVATVAGNVITLNSGAAPAIRIDATNAKFAGRDGSSSLADVTPGVRITAFLGADAVTAGAPLVAQLINIEPPPPDLVLAGKIDSIDALGLTFVVLGVTIHVDANTRYATAFPTFAPIDGLDDLQVGQPVIVDASTGASILARHVLVVSPTVDEVVTIRGKVKSITDKSWVITETTGQDRTILIDEHTKISGEPKVGDEVEVLARVDSASNTIALAILKLGLPAGDKFQMRGWVKSIAPDQWTIGGPPGSLAPDMIVKITPATAIYPDPHVGDLVQVIGTRDAAGFAVATSITKEQIPGLAEVHGTVQKMSAERWTITAASSPTPVDVKLSRETVVYRNPAVGDHVVVYGVRDMNGVILAVRIAKE